MKESKHSLALRELGELSALGAASAANALGLILGRDVVSGAQRQVKSALYRPSGDWSAGVIFEADGFLSGLVAILLPSPSRATFSALVAGDPSEGAIESALRELGNIVASHTVSAIADDLGESILLSVPTLAMDGADGFLVTLIGERKAAYCFESDLFGSDGERVAAIVFVPDFVEVGPSA
jgi:chemotaxis protein CheY-P-specific phosphatase CheC